MKVVLYVFSGTGNTLKVAELYKKYMNAEVTVCRISKKCASPLPPEGFDLVGVGYPIHAFDAPEPIREFVKNLPPVQNLRTFVFKSSGEGLHLNDGSSQKLIKILRKKGYDVMLERHFVMPYNMIYRHSNEMAKQMWIYTQAMVRLNCLELEQNRREKVKRNVFKRCFSSSIGWTERHFAHLHGPLFKVNGKKCVNCMRCVNVCPRNNIRYEDGKFKFGRKCVLCMDCSFGCPEDAVKVGIFKFWKVNGSYRLEELEKDENVYFPIVPARAKGMQRLYKKYYLECDKKLAQNGVSLFENTSYVIPNEIEKSE